MRVEVNDGAEVARLREVAAQAVDPCVTSAGVVAAFWEDAGGGAIDPQAGYEAIREQVAAVRSGVLSGAEATLVGQAIALNAIFAEMARRGQAALGRPGIAAERYLRLAMRAQAQCRLTLQALSDMAGRPAKDAEVTTPIRTIQRIIVRPRDRDEERAPAGRGLTGQSSGADEDGDWVEYGQGLDPGAARRLFGGDEGAEGVGAFDRAAYG